MAEGREWLRLMKEFTAIQPDDDLSRPSDTRSGRYWYNLHVVLEVEKNISQHPSVFFVFVLR
jgi:hypothetical protein